MTAASRSGSTRTSAFGRATTAERRADARSNGTQASRDERGGPAFSASDQLSETGSAALEFRGLDPELAVKLGVTSALVPDGGGDWVAIPFIKGGQTVNHKYRRVRKATDGRPNFAQDKGGLACWYNYDVITDQTLKDYKLIVTEGEMDSWVALQCGYPRVVSVPNGAHDKELGDRDSAKLAFVADSLTDLSEVKNIVLAVDSDPAGSTLMTDLARRLGKARCQYVVYPEGCKDLNDVLLRHGQRGVVEVVEAAKWVQVKGLFRMSELPPVPVSQPFPIGMGKLDNHMLLRKGDFTVVSGIPSHGKTSLVTDIACRMAVTHGWTVTFASFEQDPQDDHRRALRTWYHRLPAALQTPEQHVMADLWIDESFGFIVPDEDSDATVDWLLETAAAAVIRFGTDLLVVDPWNELDHAKPRDMTMTDYVNHSIRQFKRFARKFNIHVIIVAHPTKLPKDREGNLPMPTLYDISDSSAWANKPDLGVIVHRNGGFTAIKVAKVRYEDRIGTPGTVQLRFDKETMRFEGEL